MTMKLYHMLMRPETHVLCDPGYVKNAEEMVSHCRDLAEGSVLVDAQNIATFIWGDHAPALRTLTRVIPPWEHTWIEWTNRDGLRVGVQVQGTRLEKNSITKQKIDGLKGRTTNGEDAGAIYLPDSGFAMLSDVFQELNHTTMLFGGSATWFAEVNGDPILTTAGRFSGVAHASPQNADFVGFAMRIVASTFAFANCKNVSLVEEEEQYASRQLRRAAQRRNDPPLSRYYTLRIDPNEPRREASGESSGNARDLPLHIVRGHFATYSEERPLFGKYSGTFWVPAHVRGTPDTGIVGKDYMVKAPTS